MNDDDNIINSDNVDELKEDILPNLDNSESVENISNNQTTNETSESFESHSSNSSHFQPHNNIPLTEHKPKNDTTEEATGGIQGNHSSGENIRKNHQRPRLGVQPHNKDNGSNTSNVGANKLKSALSKAKGFIGKRKKSNRKNGDSSETSSDSASNDNNENDNNSTGNGISKFLSRRLKIKIIIYSVIFGLFLLIFLALIVVAFGIDLSQTFPAISPSTYGTDKYQSMYDKDSKEYQEELKYNKKLVEVGKKYSEKYGETIKTNYIHSILIYLYYKVDLKEINKDLTDVDYSQMTSLVDKIAELMKPNNGSFDYEKNGEFYNSLKNSSVFIDYYKPLLKKETATEILDGIFDLANDLDQVEIVEDTAITEETKVVPKTNSTDNTSTSSSITINDYLTDSIYASTDKLSNGEIVKAYTIAYSTNIVSQNKKLTVTSNTATADNILCSVKNGCSYNDKGTLISGGSKQSSNKNTLYYKGLYYYKQPLSSDEQNELNKNINSVFGNVLVNADGIYPSLDTSKLYGLGDGDYKSIINSAYGSDIKLTNVGENSYFPNANYGNVRVLTNAIFYDQKDYKTQYCGLKGTTIGGSGCGLTAMAIVASTYKRTRQFDPIYMNNQARGMGVCSYSGTSPSFFCREASKLGFKCSRGSKYDKTYLNNVLKHLRDGDLVIAHMKGGHFTSKGHYIVLGGVDPATKKVYVYDPNNKSNKTNRKTGNGWYKFEDIIVKEAYHFYVIWR